MANNPYGNQPIGSSSYAPMGAMGEKPKNYLVESILVTLCCCLPLGIAGIVYAAQVDGKWNSGDQAGAIASANNAKKFMMIGFGIGLALNILIFAVQALAVVGAAAGGAQGN